MVDKEIGSPFVIPAIYQPASCIPLEIWKASPSTSNWNEQAHRNVNRDGTRLTLLAAIMRGMQYDERALASIKLFASSRVTRLGPITNVQAVLFYDKVMTFSSITIN
jgi:hypothetical protein